MYNGFLNRCTQAIDERIFKLGFLGPAVSINWFFLSLPLSLPPTPPTPQERGLAGTSIKDESTDTIDHNPPSLNALKKQCFTWFLRGQTSDKICQYKKSRSSLFILDRRKWRTFYLEDANGYLLVKMFIVTLFGSNSDRNCNNVQHVIMT